MVVSACCAQKSISGWKRSSLAKFLYAYWLTIRDALAIPIRAKASRLINGRMSNKNNRAHAN
jgi:hypothetical protein